MNIIHIEDFFHPSAGYQLNILAKFMVKQGHSLTIVTSQMDKVPDNLTKFFGKDKIESKDNEYTQKNGVSIIRLPLKGFISGRAVFDDKLFKTINKLKPDILFIHGNDTLTAMRFLLRLKRINCTIVMDSHMLEMASANKFYKLYRLLYRKVFTPIIVKNRIPVIRTQDDPYVEKCLGIPLTQSPWISVGSDTLLFHPDEFAKESFRERNAIGKDDYVILYAGKLDESKGGMFLAKSFMQKFMTNRNIVLVIVGNLAGVYGKEVEDIISKSENRIIHFQTQKYTDLPKFYQAADLCVFPKQCSLSFYDAQACGLPVIAEDNSINVDRLKHGNGFTFKAGDIQDFRGKILNCSEMNEVEFKQMRDNAYNYVKENFDYEDISRQYTDILEIEYRKHLGD